MLLSLKKMSASNAERQAKWRKKRESKFNFWRQRMLVKIYSLYDCKAEAYLAPQYFPTKGIAIRAFTELSNDEGSNVCKHAEDYTLFEVGTFDDSCCAFDLYATPISVGKAIEFKKV